MRYLITGGSGFVGRYFVEHLQASGDELTILDLVRPTWDVGTARLVLGDVRDPIAVGRAVEGADAVLHLAAAHHDYGIAERTYFGVNESAAEVLCAAMDAAEVRRLCFFSSAAVYGDAPAPRHESGPTMPSSHYGASKLAGERVFRAWSGRGARRSCLVIRPTVVFGPRNYANMYSLIRQVASGAFLQVGSGQNVKSLVYVENLVDAALFLWRRHGDTAFDVFNVVDKPDLTSREIAATIFSALGKRQPPLTIPLAVAIGLALPFDAVSRITGRNLPVSSMRVRKLFADETQFAADRLRSTGFVPRVPLGEGLGRMARWFRDESIRPAPAASIPPAVVVTASTRDPALDQVVRAGR